MSTLLTPVPRQERSRVAYARTLAAATALYAKHGGEFFTLKDVSAQSGVSIGSIYSRFGSKENLIRELHRQEIHRIDTQTNGMLGKDSAPSHANIETRVRWVVESASTVLADHASFLRASMLTALHDPELAHLGKGSHELMLNHFTARLEESTGISEAGLPPSSLTWSFTVFYSVVARYLGIGSSLEAAHEGDWNQLLHQLSATITRYLSHITES